MNRKRLLAIFAWFFDLVVVECLIWPMHALYDGNTMGINYLWMIIPILIFIISIIYHVHWKRKSQWISPGEHVIGQRLRSGNKESVRMYSVHRTFMFSVILINLLNTTRSFEEVFYGVDSTWMVLMISYAFNFSLLFGSLKLSEVMFSGLIWTVVAMGMMIGSHAFEDSISFFYLMLLLANVWVYYYYRARKVPDQDFVLENSMQAM